MRGCLAIPVISMLAPEFITVDVALCASETNTAILVCLVACYTSPTRRYNTSLAIDTVFRKSPSIPHQQNPSTPPLDLKIPTGTSGLLHMRDAIVETYCFGSDVSSFFFGGEPTTLHLLL